MSNAGITPSGNALPDSSENLSLSPSAIHTTSSTLGCLFTHTTQPNQSVPDHYQKLQAIIALLHKFGVNLKFGI
jgi:hypothetical protein